MRIGFRHCDPRFPFLWQTAAQPAARWHAPGEGPANYFSDTPVGAWAEFLRHEEIDDPADLAGVQRSLWAVELPVDGWATPELPESVLFGNLDSYPQCQAEARRLCAAGAGRIEVRGAALLPGAAAGWVADPMQRAPDQARDSVVRVVWGPCRFVGWIAVDGGAPPALVLPLVRKL